MTNNRFYKHLAKRVLRSKIVLSGMIRFIGHRKGRDNSINAPLYSLMQVVTLMGAPLQSHFLNYLKQIYSKPFEDANDIYTIYNYFIIISLLVRSLS